jgi:hypothetical protein
VGEAFRRYQLCLRQEILTQHLCHAPRSRFREHREREASLVHHLLTGMPIAQRELLGGIVVQTWALRDQLGDRVPPPGECYSATSGPRVLGVLVE